MTIALDVTGTTTTTATFTFGNMGTSGTVELQLSPRSDFSFCVCPVHPGIARSSPYTEPGLNQRATYFARARTRLSSGIAEPWSNVIGLRTGDGTAQVTTPANIMIKPALIVLPDPVLEIFTSAAATISGFPEANLLIDAPVAWRAQSGTLSGVGGAYYEFAVSMVVAGTPIDTLALLNTNLPEDSYVHLTSFATRTALNAASGSPGNVIPAVTTFRASANLPGRRGYHGLFQFASSSSRFYRLVIGSKNPVLHAEHLILGKAKQTKNFSADKAETPAPLGSISRTRTGVPDRVSGLPTRKIEFDLSNLKEEQYETVYRDLMYRANDPILIVPNMNPGPFLHDRIAYGEFGLGQAVNSFSPYFTRTIVLNSLI